ncbi:MAG: DUF5658 family protein [Elusimicrobia bacterium]|nr:DUF5658 family protein [Elusimicrobiota bacterium]
MSLNQRRLRQFALWGVALYVLCAAADGVLTHYGLGDDTALEANPFVRWTMDRMGVTWALVLHKASIGLACSFIALRVGPAIHRSEAWIWRVPMLPPVRLWMRRGDRSWLALIPLYGMCLAQALAAALWTSAR